MKKFVENFFYKKDYLIITPRTHSFGGVMQSLSEGLRISISKKKKKIFCISFFNIHGKHKKKKIFGLSIIFKILKTISISEIIFTFLFSFFLNINFILEKIKLRFVIKKIFGNNFCQNYFPLVIGYNAMDDNTYFNCDEKEWSVILQNKINFVFDKKKDFLGKSNFVALYVKDINYNEISEISGTSIADIKKFRQSIDFLIRNNFQVVRTGDYLSNKFDYKDKKYLDLTATSKLSLLNQYKVFEKCEFFLGTNSPSLVTSAFFDKKRIITNVPAQYSNNTISFSKNNFSIFKKVFCIKQKKILSIEEILNNVDLFIEETSLITKSKNYFLIENSESEILETCKDFIDYNFKSIKKDESLLNQYLEQRSIAVENLFKKSSRLTNLSSIKKYRYSQVNIPNFFLKKYLYNSEELYKESKIIEKKLLS